MHHIDSLRAYAILMMLQGHFIYSLLDPVYRDPDNPVYNTWMLNKGFTAPIFFTVTGLVLVYLLVRKDDSAYRQKRIKKTVRRGFSLILWGYLLRTNIYSLLTLDFRPSFWKVDVLHCIGLGLLAVAGLYWLVKKLPIQAFQWALLIFGVLIFTFEPIYADLTYESLPVFISNYLSKANGSVFTPFPWIGYTLLGGFIGVVYKTQYHKKWLGQPYIAFAMIAAGLLISMKSSLVLMVLYSLTDIELFKAIAWNNYLFIRFGHVLIFFAIFLLFEKQLAKLNLFNIIGQSTLNIYIVHYMLLYGSFTGISLYYFFAKSLAPMDVIIGALLFMIASVLLALKIPPAKEYIKSRKPAIFIAEKFQLLKTGLFDFMQTINFLKKSTEKSD
ncbi:MAG: heparan-alpha-glucosaminide N-acetyltransferase domain-containing protein [Bacteroidota bacterium]